MKSLSYTLAGVFSNVINYRSTLTDVAHVCHSLDLKSFSFEYAAHLLDAVCEHREAAKAPVSIAAVVASLLISQASAMSEKCRIEEFELDTTMLAPGFARTLPGLSPTACLEYMSQFPTAFSLSKYVDSNGDHVLLSRTVVSTSPLITLAIILINPAVKSTIPIAVLKYYTLLCTHDGEKRSEQRRPATLGPYASFTFDAEQRVASMFVKFCTHRFMDVTWTHLQGSAEPPVSADDWMIILAQDDDAGAAIESLDLCDPSLSQLMMQLSRTWHALQHFLAHHISAALLRTIDIVAPANADFENSSHIIVLHESIPRLAVLLRLDVRAHRVFAYTLSPRPSTLASEQAVQLDSVKKEFMAKIVNLLCVFLWSRLADTAALS
jgi:hypothetical protein